MFTPRPSGLFMKHPRRNPIRRAAMLLALGLSTFAGAAVAPVSPAMAEPGTDSGVAKGVINETIEHALKILRDQELKKDSKARIGKLRAAVDGVFDWEAMAQSSIGPHWRKLDDDERRQFVDVFKELLAKQYMDDIDRFQGSEQLRVTGADTRGKQVVVKTVLITVSREEVPIDYTMHKPDGKWLVEDVAIEGVSMVNHYRKSFSRFLVNSDFDALMKRLKRKLGVS